MAGYDTDLSDDQWTYLKGYFPKPQKMGRPKKYSPRFILNAIFYLDKTGCQWRSLPKDFPPWDTVYYYFSLWTKNGLLQVIHNELRGNIRLCSNKDSKPSALIIDSQSSKGSETSHRSGYDGGKKVKGRKRHILVDTLGLLMIVIVHSAAIQDRQGAQLIFNQLDKLPHNVELIWADRGYSGELVERTSLDRDYEIEIVKHSEKQTGFKVLPKRWIVERTFSWILKNRRLSKSYERQEKHEESMVYISMIRLMLNRAIPRK